MTLHEASARWSASIGGSDKGRVTHKSRWPGPLERLAHLSRHARQERVVEVCVDEQVLVAQEERDVVRLADDTASYIRNFPPRAQ